MNYKDLKQLRRDLRAAEKRDDKAEIMRLKDSIQEIKEQSK